jgi:NDP-sugar pyrophosphorylase family protein
MKALVLAGGKGTRLGELTKSKPKCLLDIKGKPVIDYVIDNLVKHGFTEIMVNVSYLHEQVANYLGDRVTCFYEPKLLNTAGTVKAVAKWFDKSILVVNADTINNADYGNFKKYHTKNQYNTTVLSKDYKCAGAYIIEKKFVLKNFETGKSIDECLGYDFTFYEQPGLKYIDIGTPEGLERARNAQK